LPGEEKITGIAYSNEIYDNTQPFTMPVEDLILIVIISLLSGFILGYFYVKSQITAIENTYRAELERWKMEVSMEIRKDAVNRSRSTIKGKIAEQLAPVLPEFAFNPADARFIGSPVDYIIFDGLTEVADDRKTAIRIVFMDVKKGSASLTRTQRVIKKAIDERAVSWETLRIADT
jgi:predicted Holliday junction resolvase-like endonuclease